MSASFSVWMRDTEIAFLGITGVLDLRDCQDLPCQDYFTAGMTPEEAANEAMAEIMGEEGIDLSALMESQE